MKKGMNLILGSLLLASCVGTDFDDLLETSTTVTEEVSDGSIDTFAETECRIKTVCFFDTENMVIGARVRWNGTEEDWAFRESVAEEDKRGMADLARRLFLCHDENSGVYTGTYICGTDTIRLYRFGSFPTDSPRYRVIVCIENRRGESDRYVIK
jgi:hypothetical protein